MLYRIYPLLVASALVVGCARNEESLLVVGAPAWPDGGGCFVDPGASVFLSQGTLDLQFGTPYMLPAVLLNNSLVRNATKSNSGTETNELQLTSATVDLDLPQLPAVLDNVEAQGASLVGFDVTLASVSINPGERYGVAVEVVPQQTSLALRDGLEAAFPDTDVRTTLVATVVFHASRSGNVVGRVGEIDAREFTFPIQLCRGCLVSYAGCPEDYVPQSAELTSWSGGLCGNAQDSYLWPSDCMAPASN